MNFDWNEFATKINSELIGNLGNLVNRTLGFAKKTFNGKIPAPEIFDNHDKEAEEKIKKLSSEVGNLMEQNHLDRAVKKILEFTAYFNQYFQHKEPWKNDNSAKTTIYLSANAVASLAIILHPFLPASAEKIWSQIGMTNKISEQSWDSTSSLLIKKDHNIGNVTPLFSKVEESDIQNYKKKFQN